MKIKLISIFNKYFKQKKWFTLFLFLSFFIFIGEIWALNNTTTGYQALSGTSKPVKAPNPNNGCYNVLQNTGNAIFVPTRSIAEWDAFTSNSGSTVTASPWTPLPNTVCSGQNYNQTNDCLESNPAVGTKVCCSDECGPEGSKQCSGNGYQTCVADYDADSCLEWNDVTSCGTRSCSAVFNNTVGSCNNTCSGGGICSDCTLWPNCSCASGWFNCDSNPLNGCEATCCPSTDAESCAYYNKDCGVYSDVWDGCSSRVVDCGGCGTYEYCNTGVCTLNSCQGSIMANAVAYDAEESSSLTNNTTSWSYSASDTATKCQYKCSVGFYWDGNSCVINCTWHAYNASWDNCYLNDQSVGYTGNPCVCGTPDWYNVKYCYQDYTGSTCGFPGHYYCYIAQFFRCE